MILKLSIFGLVLILIAVIASQYYMSKEAFANAKRHSKHNNASDACANVSDSTPIAEVPVACLQKVFLDVGCTAAGEQFPKEKAFKSQWATFGEFRKAFSEAIKNAPKTDPDFIKACAPAMPNQLDSLDACSGISDDTPAKNIPLACAQQLWLSSGCTTKGTDYPDRLDSSFYKGVEGDTFGGLKKAMTGVKMINKTKHPLGEDPEYKRSCFGTMGSSDSSDACAGVSDDTASDKVPINCIQSQWMKLGCKKDAIGYPIDSDNVISQSAKGMDFGAMKKAVDIFIQDNLFSTDDNLRLLCNATINDIASGNQSAAAPNRSAAAPNRSAAAPQRKDIQPEISVSDTSYMAMKGKQKSDLLSSIQKIVRNELLANRVTQPTVRNLQDNDDCDTNDDSHCTAQGSEFKRATPKSMSKGCPDSSDPCDISDQPQNSVPKPYKSNMPDMSKYIKKDSIPCWGCSLDY